MYRDGIRSFVAGANLPKGAKELTRPAVLLSRLPRTRFQRKGACERHTHTHTTKDPGHVIAQLCAGNAFLPRRREREGGSIGHGARRRGGPSEEPLADEERRDVTKTMEKEEGMINTRALFSDFLPRDPRAQIACK